MSPLLRRPQTPPIITNHVLAKGPAVAQGQIGLIKPIPLHKGEHNSPGTLGLNQIRNRK